MFDTTIGEKISQISKKVKDSGISITESLIARRMEELSKARHKRGFKNMWTIDDKILFKESGKTKVTLFYRSVKQISL